jgi:molecular chaperone GrpE
MNEEKNAELKGDTATIQTGNEEVAVDIAQNEEEEVVEDIDQTTNEEVGEDITQNEDEEVVEDIDQTTNEEVETVGIDEKVTPGFTQLVSKLDTLGERFSILEVEFESKIKYDQHKEKVIDNLHKELQDYKNDLVKSLLRPIIMDIILAIDGITKLVNKHKEEESGLDPQKLLKQMEESPSELEEILFRQGVDPFNVDHTGFDPKQQKIVETEITDDQLKDKTISKRVHKGYEWEGKVLCRERVNVYLFKADSKDQKTNIEEEKEK